MSDDNFAPSGEVHPQLRSRRLKGTSKDAFRAMVEDGSLAQERSKVYDLLAVHGPLTGREVDERLGNVSGHKRLSELRRQGKVGVCGRRVCSISGKMVEEWCLASRLPGRAPAEATPAAPSNGTPQQETLFG